MRSFAIRQASHAALRRANPSAMLNDDSRMIPDSGTDVRWPLMCGAHHHRACGAATCPGARITDRLL
jgi:hypothetical protein